jgi:hypothetical protein
VALVDVTTRLMHRGIFFPFAKKVALPEVLVVAVKVSTAPFTADKYSAATIETDSGPAVYSE